MIHSGHTTTRIGLRKRVLTEGEQWQASCGGAHLNPSSGMDIEEPEISHLSYRASWKPVSKQTKPRASKVTQWMNLLTTYPDDLSLILPKAHGRILTPESCLLTSM